MRMANYTIKVVNDLMVIVFDDDEVDLPTITNSAEAVIKDLNTRVGGLGSRRVFYRDSVGRFDELCHSNGDFKGFAACKPSQQEAFKEMTRGSNTEDCGFSYLNGGRIGNQITDMHQGGTPASERRLREVLNHVEV